MPGLDHGPNLHSAADDAGSARRARLGLVLFAVYLLLYGGFVLLSALAPELMDRTPLFGVNVAVLYGFLLIIAAFVLALVYGWLCRARPGDSAQARSSSSRG
jgi:uncharacterized membrane protein (DUF485 family)